MAEAIIIPKQGNSVEEVILQSWHKNVGDAVAEGDVICEVETDKAVMEVTSTASGVLLAQFFAPDDEIPVLETVAAVGEAGEDASSLAPGGAAASPAPAAEEAAPAATSAPDAAAPAPAAAAAVTGAGSSPRARAAAQAAGVDLPAAGSGPNGLVIERDVAAVAANAPKISPAARDALAKNPALTAPARGTGPDGLVLVEDLSEATASAPAAVDTTAAPARGSKTIPVKGIRKVIAERMHGSLSSTAQLTMNTSAKATALQAYRAKAKANAEALGLPNITINDMILFAVSRVLPRFPEMNAHFLGKTIEQFDAIHLGVAVDTDRGLLVPVLKDADLLSLAGISSTFKPIAKAAQAGTIEPELLSGSTFTVTNLGASGIESFTPVLNAPEVAILGVGGLTLRPYANKEGGVDHIPTLGLSLTIDHQGLDGGPAARFLQALVQALEDFELLLAN